MEKHRIYRSWLAGNFEAVQFGASGLDMLVSAIMPTRDRASFAREALACWRAQTYEPRELVIMDDFDAPSFEDGIDEPGVLYERVRQRLTIGAKRNLCCSRANGEVICHWDDDDYSAPGRIEDQIQRLIESQKPVTGYRSMKLTNGVHWWLYTGASDYALGTSLMYERDWWLKYGFEAIQVGEDNSFAGVARARGAIVSADAGDLMWARIHPGNTSAKDPHGNPAQWRLLK